MPITFLMAFFSCCSSGFLSFLQYSSSSTKARSVSKNEQVKKISLLLALEILKCSNINFTFLKPLCTHVRNTYNEWCCVPSLAVCHDTGNNRQNGEMSTTPKQEDHCESEISLRRESDLLNGIHDKSSTFIYPKPAGICGVWTKLQFAEATKLQTITTMDGTTMQENWP